ncbi:MAG: hypothetical protein GEU73_14920 [Chloroflexi bacterium]|nr:hypothetical protein [Chloroflexota bacterium]
MVTWNQAFIRADAMFADDQVVRPKHVLEQPYSEDKSSIFTHPYWTDQHIGTGAFKLREWVRGSHAVLEAFDQYVLGRPMIEPLGYTRGPDGMFLDAAGQRLALEVRTSGGDDTHESGVLSVVDSLRRAGIAAEPYFIPQAERQDRAANVSYPGLRLWRLPNDLWDLNRYHSRQAGTPENNFRQNSNRARYMNPDLDALIDRYIATISGRDRIPLLAQVVQHQSDQVSVIGLWYNAESIVVSNRLRNVASQKTGDGTVTWNAHLWDVTS